MLVNDHRKRVLDYAERIGCSIVVSFNPENTFYLTGFWGESVSICSGESTKIITPALEMARAEEAALSCELISAERGKDILLRVIDELAGKFVCTDSTDFHTISVMVEKLGKSNVKVNNKPFTMSRIIKDFDEQEKISMAAKIIDSLFNLSVEEIRENKTEIELMALLVSETYLLGGALVSYKSTRYPFIIAGGPNAAFPHSEITKRPFSTGDTVIVDLVVQYQGYVADATRTFVIGHAADEIKQVYECVKEAQQIGLESLRLADNFGLVDLACRNVIAERGYGSKFIHSTGHGIGLEVHESPWINKNGEEMVKPGMAVTIEPGIYTIGKFGVRIEDSVIIKTANRKDKSPKNRNTISNLNSFPKELICLG
ncbi:MAG: M24 family metallopeptidase [Nitrososphaeraceae archaeon]